ncbi:MAG TPA: FeoA family protein [Methanobacteriaceae archaeon]|nr:FeoA family protein [Methanobacteriaceae archaeon]
MITINQLENGEAGIINEIIGGHGFIKRLESLNLRKGKQVLKISSAPFKGPVVLEVEGCQIALGVGIASKILVKSA